jgi:hypothetical protein
MVRDRNIDIGQEEVMDSSPDDYMERLSSWKSFVYLNSEISNCTACGAFNCYLPKDKRITCKHYADLSLNANERCIDLRNKMVRLILVKGINVFDWKSYDFGFYKCNICSQEINFSVRIKFYLSSLGPFKRKYYFIICEDCYKISNIEEIRSSINLADYHWTGFPKYLDLILKNPFTIEREEVDDEYKKVSYVFQYEAVREIVDTFLETCEGIIKDCLVINKLS